jgi:hypothetical protein
LGTKCSGTKQPETKCTVDKMSCEENLQRDKMSSGTNILRGKKSYVQNVQRDKMSSETKCPEKNHPNTLKNRPVTMKKRPNRMKKKWRVLGLLSCIRYTVKHV